MAEPPPQTRHNLHNVNVTDPTPLVPSWLKVRSSLIRLVKRAYQKHGVSMPDEAREVVFPQGVPVTLLQGTASEGSAAAPEKPIPDPSADAKLDAVSTKAEAGFSSEAGVIEEQARQAQPLQTGENLLPDASNSSSVKEPLRKSPTTSDSTRTSP